MFWLGITAVLLCLVGSGIAIGYALGHSHGAAEKASVEWEQLQRQQHRHKRCTPEPVRLRLVDDRHPAPAYVDFRHPVFFDQDGDIA